MGARKELNKYHVLGRLSVAAILGGLTASWAVFANAAAVLLGTAMYTREIRGKSGGR